MLLGLTADICHALGYWVHALPSYGKWEKLQQKCSCIASTAHAEVLGCSSGAQAATMDANMGSFASFVITCNTAELCWAAFPFLLVLPVIAASCAAWVPAVLLLVQLPNACKEKEWEHSPAAVLKVVLLGKIKNQCSLFSLGLGHVHKRSKERQRDIEKDQRISELYRKSGKLEDPPLTPNFDWMIINITASFCAIIAESDVLPQVTSLCVSMVPGH